MESKHSCSAHPKQRPCTLALPTLPTPQWPPRKGTCPLHGLGTRAAEEGRCNGCVGRGWAGAGTGGHSCPCPSGGPGDMEVKHQETLSSSSRALLLLGQAGSHLCGDRPRVGFPRSCSSSLILRRQQLLAAGPAADPQPAEVPTPSDLKLRRKGTFPIFTMQPQQLQGRAVSGNLHNGFLQSNAPSSGFK